MTMYTVILHGKRRHLGSRTHLYADCTPTTTHASIAQSFGESYLIKHAKRTSVAFTVRRESDRVERRYVAYRKVEVALFADDAVETEAQKYAREVRREGSR